MSNQFPLTECCMRIGPDEGCHEVPDAIAPIDMTLVSLEPTRIPRSFPLTTNSGPMFVFVSPIFMPGICAIGLADGLTDGIGVFISFCGDGAGVTDGAGIFMPGISVLIGLGEGKAFGVGDGSDFWGPGIFMPGISVIDLGEGDGVGLGKRDTAFADTGAPSARGTDVTP